MTSLSDLFRAATEWHDSEWQASINCMEGLPAQAYMQAAYAAARDEHTRLEPYLALAEKILDRLTALLADTQHSDHDCGDEQCPVDAARRVVTEARQLLEKGGTR